jgi:hypothetical protein
VSHEVLALLGGARYLQTSGHLDSAGRARGLSGAPDGARGRRTSPEDLHRLDPDGWLGQPTADSNSIESPASREDQRVNSHRADIATGYGLCGKLLRTFQQIPQPRRRRDAITSRFPRFGGPSHPVLGKLCPLDKELLMGGTFSEPKKNVARSTKSYAPDAGGRGFAWSATPARTTLKVG